MRRGWALLAGAVLAGACAADDPIGLGAPPTSVTTPTTTSSSSTTTAAPSPPPTTTATTTTSSTSTIPFDPDLPTEPIVVIRATGVVDVLDPQTGAATASLLADEHQTGERPDQITISPDERLWVTWGHFGSCDRQVFEWADGELEPRLRGGGPAFSVDGRWMAHLVDGAARFGEPPLLTGQCVHETIVVTDLETGEERAWRLPAPIGDGSSLDLWDAYLVGGTPGGLEFSPDGETLSFIIAGEGFTTSIIDVTSSPLEARPVVADAAVERELAEVLPSGWGIAPTGWSPDNRLEVLFWSYHAPGYAIGTASGEVVDTIVDAHPENGPPFVVAENQGYRLTVHGGVLQQVRPDGTTIVLTDGVRQALWSAVRLD